VGRLSREKGHADLLEALARMPRLTGAQPIELLLVGDGPERAPLESLAARLQLSAQVRFLGHRDSVRIFYSLADVFALPSHSEGSPNVLLEAIEAGAPVVATAVGGVPEMVSDGVEALLVPPQNSSAAAVALARLLDDRELSARLIANARLRLQAFTPECYFRNILAVLEAAGAGL
jgi:glycosyltransferase involved in cell wall biosynthesis